MFLLLLFNFFIIINSLKIVNNTFLLNNKPFTILGGNIDYYRVFYKYYNLDILQIMGRSN